MNDYAKLQFKIIGDKEGEKEVKSQISNIKQEAENSNKHLGKLGGFLITGGAGEIFKRTAQKIGEAVKVSADYIEELNVLDVAFNNNSDSAKEYAKSLSETLNLDDSTIIHAISHFKVLSQSMSMANETGEVFSKLLTQMSIDASSLFNLDFKKSQSMLQYAVEGRGQTLKQRTGVSVLESTVQQTLDSLGIDAYVEDMNDTEKAIARLISMSYQLRNAQGDLARTIEAPANQIRVFGEQVSLVARNIGNIFLPIVANLLPYLNAVLIVINRILSSLATLLGFNVKAWDFFGGEDTESTWDSLGESVGGVGNALDGVGKSAKKAKDELKGLRGFDKLNVINTPQDTGGSGGGGGGGVGGVNPALLKALSDIFGNYNTELDGIKTKATQIADAFFEWAKCLEPLAKPLKEISGLAFTGIIYVWENVIKPLGAWIAEDLIPAGVKALAGALELVYQVGQRVFGIYKNIYEIVIQPVARVLGGAIVGALEDLGKVLNAIAKNKFLTTVLAWSVALKSLSKVIKPLLALPIAKNLKASISLIATEVSSTKSLSSGWKTLFTLLSPNLKKTTNDMTTMQKAQTRLQNGFTTMKTVAKGALEVLAGFEILKSSFNDIAKNGLTVGNVLGTIAGAILAVIGAVTALNAVTVVFGVTLDTIPIIGWASAIIGIGSAIYTLIGGMNKFNENSGTSGKVIQELDGYYKNFNETIKNVNSSLENTKARTEENILARMSELEQIPTFIGGLDELTDANFRVKDGYEQEANTLINFLNNALGLNLELTNGVIYNDGQQIKSKQELMDITDKYIEKVKKQTLYEAYQELYKDAIIQQMKAKQAYNVVEQETIDKLTETNKKLNDHKITAEEAGKIVEDANKKMKTATKSYHDTLRETDGIIEASGKVTTAYATGTSKDVQNAIDSIGKGSKTYTDDLSKNYKTAENEVKLSMNKVRKEAKNTVEEMKKNSKVDMKLSLDTKGARKEFNRFANDVNNSGSATAGFKVGKVPAYAMGGMPNTGQMFIANERGPELIGQIGGQSFVANQNQMLDIIDRKLQNAGGMQNATFIIQVGDEQVAKKVLKDLNGMAKSNGKPITITG